MLRGFQFRALAVGLLLLASWCGGGRLLAYSGEAEMRHHAPQPPAPAKGPTHTDLFWAQVREEVYKSPEALIAQNRRELQHGIHYRKLMRGNRDVRAVALTFDDGPHPVYTLELLALLKKYHVKATFFVVGEMAERYPDLIRAEYEAGDTIGNHTYHHVNLTKIPGDRVEMEWQACSDVVRNIIGITPKFCRPPGGDYDRKVILAAQRVGLTTVLWTDDPGDYADPGDGRIEYRVLDNIHNGAIILLHDGIQETVNVLPKIIEHIRRRGFEFQTIDQMAKDTLR